MYTLEWTPNFIKAAKRFAKQHPELKQKTAIVLLALEQDPFQPSLKTHGLKTHGLKLHGLKLHGLGGKLKGMHAIRITYSYRITLILKVSAQMITLLDIGDHGDVY